MVPAERTQRILDILKTQKYVTPKFLKQKLYCSSSTIRRDLIALEKRGLLQRHHGNVTLVPKANVEQPNYFREMKNLDKKKHICSLAVNYISNGDSLFLDSSSTVMNICPHLNKFMHLVVITNGIKTSLELSQNKDINSFLIGGQVKHNSSSTVGEFASSFVNKFKGTLCIISCRGIDENGIYEADHNQALVKEHMINSSDKTILLCDSSKFQKSHFFKLVSFDKIHMIITDKQPSESIIKALEDSDTKIIW